MSKKIKIMLCTAAILVGIYLLNIALKDDIQQITKAMDSLHYSPIDIAHIEFLDNNQAIAFYEQGNQENIGFGSALFKKNLLGWKLITSNSGDLSHGYKLDWAFSNLAFHFSDYTDLIRGKILDPQIQEVNIKTTSGNEFTANIIEYNNDEKFWFLVTKGEDLLGATITGLSSDGKVIEQLTQ